MVVVCFVVARGEGLRTNGELSRALTLTFASFK